MSKLSSIGLLVFCLEEFVLPDQAVSRSFSLRDFME